MRLLHRKSSSCQSLVFTVLFLREVVELQLFLKIRSSYNDSIFSKYPSKWSSWCFLLILMFKLYDYSLCWKGFVVFYQRRVILNNDVILIFQFSCNWIRPFNSSLCSNLVINALRFFWKISWNYNNYIFREL